MTPEGRSRVRLPQGVSDLPPGRAQVLADLLSQIGQTFHRAGYERVFTPLFELESVLARGLGASVQKAAFRFVDPASGEVVVLRPDFTAQIARLVAARLDGAPRPLRLAYQGRVARAFDSFGRGMKTRDLFQAGIERIGEHGLTADLEVLGLAVETARAVGHTMTLELGHAAIVDAFLPPNDPESPAVQAALDRKDPEAVRALCPALLPLLKLYGDHTTLDRGRAELASAPPSVHDALAELTRLTDALLAAYPDASLVFDLGAQRTHGYYTGFFFQGFVEGAPDAVLRGGRYDRLLGRFGKAEPAVGLGVDAGALARAMHVHPDPLGSPASPARNRSLSPKD